MAYHIIMTCYGFWLPNDPRGSGSRQVWSKRLREFGPATHTNSPQSVARRPHDHRVRRLAKSALKYPAVVLDGRQALAVAKGLKSCLHGKSIVCHACAILPEHVHLVLMQTADPIDDVMIDLKTAAVHQLLIGGLHPFQAHHERGQKLPKMWARGGRKVFLFDQQDIRDRIEYVEDNPTFAGLPRQTWSFVQPFNSLRA